MPQEIRVVKCYRCELYQADIVKKAKKWQCKLCGEKQAVLKEFKRGTGDECRQVVQKLNENKNNIEFNLLKANLSNNESQNISTNWIDEDMKYEAGDNSYESYKGNMTKWSSFVDESDQMDNDSSYKENSLEVFESSRSFNFMDSSKSLFKRSIEDDYSRPSKFYKSYENTNIGDYSNCRRYTETTSYPEASKSQKLNFIENKLDITPETFNAQNNSKWSKYFMVTDEN